MRRVEILSVGNEVVGGAVADTNAAWLAGHLEALGLEVVGHRAVRDRRPEIVAALEAAAAASDVVVVTGGLGPTPDDLTREAAADAVGRRLVPSPDAETALRAFFRRRGREAHPSNLKQATVPEGAAVLPNRRGTAAGFALAHRGSRFFFLPGVPAEMRGMFDDEVAPRLRGQGSDGAACCRQVPLFGVPESEVGARLKDLMARGANPEVGTLAKTGLIVVRILARGPDDASAAVLADRTAAEVRRRFGEHVVAEEGDSLPEAVVGELLRSGRTLAVAESCTGGLVAKMLTDVPGVSAGLLEAVVAYSNAAKVRRLDVPERLLATHGAVSREVAEAMARGVRAGSGANLGLAVTGIAGPGGAVPAARGRAAKPVGLVYLAAADERGIVSEEARLGGHRAQVRTRAAMMALDLLRRRLREG